MTNKILVFATAVMLSFAIYNQLAILRVGAMAGPRPVEVVGLSTHLAYGPASAPYTVALFTDYECPFCRRAEAEILPQIKAAAQRGRVRLLIQDFPLPMHKDANRLARAIHCAEDAKQAHALFSLGVPSWEGLPKEWRDCSASDDSPAASDVASSVALANKIGVKGTPTFLVGKTRPNNGLSGYLLAGVGSASDVLKYTK